MRRPRVRLLGWAAHLGALPLLFFLPVYLGYADWTFTSVGPSGGVLYPWLLNCCTGGRMSEAEVVFVQCLPRILEPLSPDIGQPIAFSGRGCRGPIALVELGAVVAAAVLVMAWLRRQLRPHAFLQSQRS